MDERLLGSVARRSVACHKRLVPVVGKSHHRQQAPGRMAALGVALFESLEDRDVEDARRSLGPLDVAADPEDGLGHPAQEGLRHRCRFCWCCCCCCCCCCC